MLSWNEVSKSFGTRAAVDAVTLAARPGEILGLLGPNGAGKTTLMHMAVGLIAPDGGTVSIGDRGSPRSPEARKALGVATQALSLYDDLSGREQLQFLASLYGISGRRASRQIDWALAFVGLADRAGDRTKTYSIGMKRRLNLACALVHDPDVVLLDEPTAGVDPQSRERIVDNVDALRSLGRTVIYTTHYLDEAERLCDRVAIMDGGRLSCVGTIDELLEAHPLAPPSSATSARSGSESSQQPARGGGKLEQVFLCLTGRSLRDE
ncbi:MAG: ABC transporter ATP-binding protein [Deltaproteobacteria bacterium]|nr:ABC transporter ATP-binding protein [Deltaproteobacteria bacterium]